MNTAITADVPSAEKLVSLGAARVLGSRSERPLRATDGIEVEITAPSVVLRSWRVAVGDDAGYMEGSR